GSDRRGSSRLCCESSKLQVLAPSIACIRTARISGACGGNEARSAPDSERAGTLDGHGAASSAQCTLPCSLLLFADIPLQKFGFREVEHPQVRLPPELPPCRFWTTSRSARSFLDCFRMTTIRKSWSGSTQNAWITLFSRLSGSKINRIVYAQKPNRKRRLSMLRLGQAMFRWSSIILFACAACLTTSSSAAGQNIAKKTTATPTRDAGLAAWQQIYSVLTHPRCINCHTATNYPQQGDDRHRHLFNIIRGPGGKGVAGLNCVTCHYR